ncbi:unnamed protein product [Hermetia illucens]|uniref:Uncharacterized protein n=1 Tax=Hermetia illucens TaxID=343691 RepID=A0A7R8V5F5_HERIL|nr:unnamed protein product [Hermetia illucens]
MQNESSTGSFRRTCQARKSELQMRVIELLERNFHEVAPKIREIYKSCSSEDRNSPSDFGAPDPKRMYQPQLQLPVQPTTPLVPNQMVIPFPGGIQPNFPIHPDVRLKKLAFYDILATLIQPKSLVPTNTQRVQESVHHFTLTPQQATDIASNRDIRNGSKIEHTIQVQLRFCLLETSCEQDDCFPPSIIVKVNNKLCPLPNPIPTNRPNVEPKRPPRPVNVTSNVKLSPTVSNSVSVQWCPDFTRGYVLAAYLVRKLTSQELLRRMKAKGIKPADYTRALIKEKLNEDADCEIATTMLKVSLICPLGKMRMTIPCRASTCSHLQCFDALLYLQMNERKPTWNCPVCDKPAVYETLVIDGYFQEVLVSPLLTGDDNEIQLHKDGSWSTHVMRSESQVLDTPSKHVHHKVEVISDDLEVITTEPDQKIIPKSLASINQQPSSTEPSSTNNEPTSTTTSDTVDLTLSDSDDDLPLKRKTTTKAPTSVGNGQQKTSAVTSTKTKQNDSIISLDSPSPPSSPVLPRNGLSHSGDVSSTTFPNCPSKSAEGSYPPRDLLHNAIRARCDFQCLGAFTTNVWLRQSAFDGFVY